MTENWDVARNGIEALVSISLGRLNMLRTIMVGTYISVQGLFVKDLPNGRIAVRVGNKVFQGKPV